MSSGDIEEPISEQVELATDDVTSDEAVDVDRDEVATAANAETEVSAESVEEDPLESALAESRENYDRFLRATAELENYRKRTAKVRSESREEALRDVLLQIAPILDNMRRALVQDTDELQSFKDGIELINNQFQETLRGYGLEEIEAMGQPFDPSVHEALLEVEHADHPAGTVVEEMEKGYKLNNKVVRPARVIVSKGSATTDAGEA
jgi:molecular chaperone GrpE